MEVSLPRWPNFCLERNTQVLRPPTRSSTDTLAGQTNNPVNTAKESPSLADVVASYHKPKCHPGRSRALLSTTSFFLQRMDAGRNIVLLADCQRISHLWSTASVVFCIVFCDRAGVFREHHVFAAAFAVCFRRYKSRLPFGLFLSAPLPHVRDFDGYFITDVSCEILQPTSYTISRRHWFRQVLDARP